MKKSSMAAAGKEPGPAPGTQAAIAAASCCAKRGTRHTSGPGNLLSRTSAQRSGLGPSPARPAGAQDRRRRRARQWRVRAGLGGALRQSRDSTAAYRVEGWDPEGSLANGRARMNSRRRVAVTAGWDRARVGRPSLSGQEQRGHASGGAAVRLGPGPLGPGARHTQRRLYSG